MCKTEETKDNIEGKADGGEDRDESSKVRIRDPSLAFILPERMIVADSCIYLNCCLTRFPKFTHFVQWSWSIQILYLFIYCKVVYSHHH